jgi:porin
MVVNWCRLAAAEVRSWRAAGVYCAALAALPALLAAHSARADERSPYLTGDWNGRRTALADAGVVPYLTYIPGEWANVHGGFETGTRYVALADLGVDLDLDRIAGWRGAQFHADMHWTVNGDPSGELVGQFGTDVVSGYETANAVRFYQIYVEQRLHDDSVLIKVGQITTDQDFYVSAYSGSLSNGSFSFFGSGRDQFLAPYYPLAGPGIYLQAHLSDQWEVRTGVYTADVGVDDSSNHGFGWSLGHGASGGLEIATTRSPGSLPGRYTVGTVGTTRTLTNFAELKPVHGTFSVLAMMDQALSLDADGKPKLGAFLRVAYSPLEDRAVLRVLGNAGFTLYAPFASRGEDSFSLGVSHTQFAADYLRDQRASGQDVTSQESIFELSYNAVIRPWFAVQPDFQLVLDPHYSHHNAVVLGVQAIINF